MSAHIEDENQLKSDNLEQDKIQDWFVDSSFHIGILKQLYNNQLRILEGPRGTGKTHMMRFAYLTCIKDKSKPAAIFVSLNKYIYVDDKSKNSTNQYFHQWLLVKIIIGGLNFMEECGIKFQNPINFEKNLLMELVNKLESPYEAFYNISIDSEINIATVTEFLNLIIEEATRKHCILLLDDAALSLSPKFFDEFLEIFRSFKTSKISPKASVYPGTVYSNPKFQLNHEGDKVNCWLDTERPEYNEIMKSIASRRSQDDLIDSQLLDFFITMAFGIPRNLFRLLDLYKFSSVKQRQARINQVIEEYCEFIMAEYLTLKSKKPEYKNIVENGNVYFDQICKILKNNNLERKKVNTIIGIEQRPMKPLESKMQLLLEEAGLIYKYLPVSHGENRSYDRFKPNLAFLFKIKGIKNSKGTNIEEINELLTRSEKQHPVRIKFDKLFENKVITFELSMPPCQNCMANRISENSKFCHNCGKPLISKSAYDTCKEMKIEDMPLTSFIKSKLNNAGIVTIEDFLAIQNPTLVMKKQKGIGPVKAEKVSININSIFKSEMENLLA